MRWLQYAYALGAALFLAAAVLEVFVPLARGTPLFPWVTGAGHREAAARRALARQKLRRIEGGIGAECWELKERVDAASRARKVKGDS